MVNPRYVILIMTLHYLLDRKVSTRGLIIEAMNAETMRKKLLQIRADLEAVAATGDASAEVVELDQSKVGRLSRMDAMQAQAMAQAAAQRREQMLRQITAALGRIDRDEYGDCQSCDEPINEKRLDFDPTTTLCIDCASESEQK
jgi:RNA polymerase-binding transcription factor